VEWSWSLPWSGSMRIAELSRVGCCAPPRFVQVQDAAPHPPSDSDPLLPAGGSPCHKQRAMSTKHQNNQCELRRCLTPRSAGQGTHRSQQPLADLIAQANGVCVCGYVLSVVCCVVSVLVPPLLNSPRNQHSHPRGAGERGVQRRAVLLLCMGAAAQPDRAACCTAGKLSVAAECGG
jgi:hypothetical protein